MVGVQQLMLQLVQLEPGLWSLSNWGDVLIATIANGKTYAWDASASSRLSIRASRTTLSPGSSSYKIQNIGCNRTLMLKL